jgi:riboflavin synthase
MFTGLVEAMGSVRNIEPEAVGIRLEISVPEGWAAASSTDRLQLGESVAIDGCCLTVVELSESSAQFQAGTETLSKTTLGRLEPGDRVNLERSLPANGRFGGHIVQGHVDGTADVESVTPEGDWTRIVFSLPVELARLLVPKGSVAVAGVSLTVVNAADTTFDVALIPHTLRETILGGLKPGDRVNIETDILGKYVARLLGDRGGC